MLAAMLPGIAQGQSGWRAGESIGGPMQATELTNQTMAPRVAQGRQALQPQSVQTLPPVVGTPSTAPAFPSFQPIPGTIPSPSDNLRAPAQNQPYGNSPSFVPQNFGNQQLAPGFAPQGIQPGYAQPPVASLGTPLPDFARVNPLGPRQIIAPVDVYVQEGRTGRVIFGGTVNSDLGVAGGLVIEEKNFDFRQLQPGNRFLLGGRQHLRIEAMPGNEVQRYTFNWTQPNLFGVLPYSLSLGGFFYTRELRDWQEQRFGGRIVLGTEITRDLSLSGELRAEDVKVFRPRVSGVAPLDTVLGSNDVYRARLKIARDTRDSPFLSSAGGLLQLTFDQVFGEYDYSRGEVTWLRHWTVGDVVDPSAGLSTISHSLRLGITGSQTPIFDNFYAGGFSTLRGFEFRGASPRTSDVEVGGELKLLGSLEYAMPLTVDNMLRSVAFVDYGTVEEDLKIDADDFRVSLGLGLRVSVPAFGPAPFAFDFAYPITMADTDERNIFSFYIGATR